MVVAPRWCRRAVMSGGKGAFRVIFSSKSACHLDGSRWFSKCWDIFWKAVSKHV